MDPICEFLCNLEDQELDWLLSSAYAEEFIEHTHNCKSCGERAERVLSELAGVEYPADLKIAKLFRCFEAIGKKLRSN